MQLEIDQNLLKRRTPIAVRDWTLWEKKNLNMHRGLIEWSVPDSLRSIDEIADEIRQGVRAEFRPRWFRGFGFGTILHFSKAPTDFNRICEHVDTRSSRHGTWQWTIACLDQARIAIGVHTWLHGYLRPVYESLLVQFTANGFDCHASDAEPDALVAMLQRIAGWE